jgi:hypothetical protein
VEFHKGRAVARLFVFLSLLALVFAVIASTSQLWFLPPSKVNGAWTPPHLLVYDYIWNLGREFARWGLSQGVLPEDIRQFKSQGVPAFLPWLGLSGLLLVFASVVGFISLFTPGSAGHLKHEVEPSLRAANARSLEVGDTKNLTSTARPSVNLSSSSGSKEPLPETADSNRVEFLGSSAQANEVEKLVEESLLYSEAQLSLAQESVERLRRALVNVYLDAGSTATEDMQDLRTSIEELEITIETLKGEQHRVMAALVSQAASSSRRPNVSVPSH